VPREPFTRQPEHPGYRPHYIESRLAMPEENEIILEVRDGVTIVHFHGDVTVFSEPFLKDAYSRVNDHGAGRILLKFDADAYINSGGIALLIQLLAQTRKNSQTVAITGLSSHFKKIFHMVGITKFAKVYDNVEEAMHALTT
jgi:anti-anti-sigma factor